MIHQLLDRFDRHNRDVEALTYVLLAVLLFLFVRASLLLYEAQFDDFWSVLTQITSLVAALLIARVANRLIVNGAIIREDDRRLEIARTTHHLIAITNDLKGQVQFVKRILDEGKIQALALQRVAKTIEDRYETLLERDAYKFLPGKCIDVITRMSGSIFGIGLLAESVKHAISIKPTAVLKEDVLRGDLSVPLNQLDELIKDIEELSEGLLQLRLSIEAKAQ